MCAFFNQIPADLRLPFAYAEFDPTYADQGPALMSYTVLLCGQMLTGVAEAYETYRPTSFEEANRLFGEGSMLAQMVGAYLKANPVTKMVAIGVPDFKDGIPAKGAISISGQVTLATPICLYIGGQLVRLGLNANQEAADIKNALRDLINSSPNLAVSAYDNGNDLELIAKHKGESGNDIDVRLSYLGEDKPSGLEIKITKLATGVGNPDPIPMISAMSGERYHVIAWPWLDLFSLDALKNELDERWGPLRQMDGQALVVKSGSFAEVLTFSGKQNNKHLTVIPNEGSPTLPWVDTAASSGIIAYYGNNDPARPFHTLTIPKVLAPAKKDRWSDFPEKNQALFEGCSVRYVTPSGEMAFSKLITTYRFNDLGAEDKAFLSLNTPLTLSYLRYDWNNYLKKKYPRHKLASDEAAKLFGPGQPIMTPNLGRAEAIARFKVWLHLGLVEAPAQFAADIMVKRNEFNENRLDWLLTPDLVNQFEVAGTCIRHLL